MTTEHFTLQGARTAAITESTSRATIFIGSVSAGLVALGLIATATRIGTAFYAFGLILLSTLSFLGFVTLDRVLQSGIEELHYVERIARLRAYYFDFAPELTRYLASVPPSGRLAILGLRSGYWPAFRTTAGMIGMVTAVLTGSDAGLLATIAAGHSAVAGFVTGGVVGVAVLMALMWFQYSAWARGHQLRSLRMSRKAGRGVISVSLTMAANRQLRSPTALILPVKQPRLDAPASFQARRHSSPDAPDRPQPSPASCGAGVMARA